LTDAQSNLQRNRNLEAFIPAVDMKKEGSDSNLIAVGKRFSLLKCYQIPIESSGVRWAEIEKIKTTLNLSDTCMKA